jgi:AAA domain
MKNGPPIIELTGPPGAGKSTLAEFLLRQDGDMRVQTFPDFRRLRDDPFFVRNAMGLVPTLLRLYRNRTDGWLTSRDIALMTILQGWHRELERLAVCSGKTVILEEGAICLLAKLHGFGAEPVRSDNARRWWDETYRRWAETLDLIIVLEASPPTLLQRVRKRGLAYEIDEMTDEEAVGYLAHIGAAQGQVLSALAAMPGGPQILRFNTEDHSLDQFDFLDAVNRCNRPC